MCFNVRNKKGETQQESPSERQLFRLPARMNARVGRRSGAPESLFLVNNRSFKRWACAHKRSPLSVRLMMECVPCAFSSSLDVVWRGESSPGAAHRCCSVAAIRGARRPEIHRARFIMRRARGGRGLLFSDFHRDRTQSTRARYTMDATAAVSECAPIMNETAKEVDHYH